MSYPERPPDNDDLEGRVVVSRRVARDAARLFQLLSEAIEHPGREDIPSHRLHDRLQLVGRARAILAGRQLRNAHFSRAMFGEPAWEILLVLYIMERDGERQTPSRLASWTSTPLSTTVRWIDYLEKKQLVTRHSHPNDKRIVFIALEDRAREAMDSYLSSVPYAEG